MAVWAAVLRPLRALPMSPSRGSEPAAATSSARLPTALQTGQYEKALEDYTAALRADPRSSYALYNRGILNDRLGSYAAAIQDFSAAIELEPHNSDFYHNRGYALRKLVKPASPLPCLRAEACRWAVVMQVSPASTGVMQVSCKSVLAGASGALADVCTSAAVP